MLRDKSCEVYFAPFDVHLFSENKDDKDVLDVVQPDLTVICDKSKLDDHGCNGSPDFILEILSPSNTNYDRWTKYKTYEKAGVREYWIVDPFYETGDRTSKSFYLANYILGPELSSKVRYPLIPDFIIVINSLVCL
ncbi:Uma2 family endonuclease [Schinkia azotoformans]|uniref:Uma2 family endonuclease n=1 Tax=Schinkia azotoformans TaxID=1454 RepID=UPI0022771C62|nr:Uma2 family endonuclease [Schinkia azotoformans]MEC1697403.1 Uma2 family endonuclease [Schinkia azotoformans]MEC1723422.1 Uma2 family endonuclease [Schinkia azotoformans]MEC1741293.1 Uma2 family endonuclease [Schinkia azotoformans]MEC1768498.1 Uma2 family endonuclease [Schinkia azotoformans]MEC1770326.1 Uma2 family endonuclease [Schinkia azotoformans]